jgi:hypothetical protein
MCGGISASLYGVQALLPGGVGGYEDHRFPLRLLRPFPSDFSSIFFPPFIGIIFALAALCPSLLDIRSIGYGLAVGMVGGEVRTVANEGQCAGILTPVSWSAIGLIRLPSLFL